jgi:chemotaxis protein methyltransferase CheR
MPLIASNPVLGPEEYQLIADKVYAHSRIRLGSDKQALVTGRLAKRLRALGLESFAEYCELLDSAGGAEEMTQLTDLISTNHTNFFREVQHLDFLRDTILPALVPQLIRAHQPFRTWSAASSSGEEAYTMCIVLAEFARAHGTFLWQVEATDISTRILAKAKAGVYAADHVRVPTPDLLPRYFQKGSGESDGFYRVKDNLRAQVKFHHINLLQAQYPVAANQHVIFCRNVMIYFDTATQQELVSKLIRQLAPGGHLIVGHSESLLGVKHPLKTVATGIYQKA